MRRLMILPIVHSRSDLGSLQMLTNQAKVAALGMQATEAIARSIDEFWIGVRQTISDMQLDYARVVIFQDGLPVVANVALQIEKSIVRDLARAGSPNHLLVQWMMEQGAILVGTESPELLLQEYEAVKRNLADGFRNVQSSPHGLSRSSMNHEATDKVESNTEVQPSLLTRRDQFIAARIDSTLGEEQIGMLFIGMLHEVEKQLPDDVQVEYPVGRPQRSLVKVI